MTVTRSAEQVVEIPAAQSWVCTSDADQNDIGNHVDCGFDHGSDSEHDDFPLPKLSAADFDEDQYNQQNPPPMNLHCDAQIKVAAVTQSASSAQDGNHLQPQLRLAKTHRWTGMALVVAAGSGTASFPHVGEVRNHDEQRLPAAPTDTQGLADEAGEEALIDNSVSDVKEQARPCVQRQSTLAAFDWDRSSAAPTHTQDIADEVGVEAVNNALELGKPLPDKAEMAESREVVLEAGTPSHAEDAIGRRDRSPSYSSATSRNFAPLPDNVSTSTSERDRTLLRASHPTQVDEVTDELLRAELTEAKEVPGMKAESDSEMGETSSRSELGKAAETATEVEVGTEKLSKLVEEPEYRRYRPFTPYRHAPTAEDLLHRAIRGRALALPGAISQASHPTQVDEVTDELSGADKLAEAREGAEPGGASRFKEAERAIIPKVDETSGEVSGADGSRLVAQEAREGTESEEAPHHMEAEKGIDDVLDSDGGVINIILIVLTVPILYMVYSALIAIDEHHISSSHTHLHPLLVEFIA
ncbi:hypothetical protein B0H13DRAFT_2419109 [Mycena leptocephala]|nr:hypothetical protein B0H13DRAFT_2419109 [Mycena leptocephala]